MEALLCQPVLWKGRRAYCLSNGIVELTVLLGGGHIASFGFCRSSINVIWEAPWITIEPETFVEARDAPLYGTEAVGKLLCGYTGHLLALGYFGMPTQSEIARGLSLHGEAAASPWKVIAYECTEHSSSLTLEVDVPSYGLAFRRTFLIQAQASTVRIRETVRNVTHRKTDFQWVQHATFGEPLFSKGEASLVVPGTRAVTWPLGYEGSPLIAKDEEFRWPHAPRTKGESLDLTVPFAHPGTGFVASVLLDGPRNESFIAVQNRKLGLAAGYVFDRRQFPWVALWEENEAREDPPWCGKTKVRGVEFGTSPMPLGLEYAKQNPVLFGVPTLSRILAGEELSTTYQLFVSRIPPEWGELVNVHQDGSVLKLKSTAGREISVSSS